MSSRDPLSFASYEDYLDAQVSDADRAYLDSVETQRALVELGFRGSGDMLSRAEFYARQQADRKRHLQKDASARDLASAGKDLGGRPLLQALAAREELVRNGKLNTIIFVRDKNGRGQEVSGYMDYAQRLKTDEWEPIFDGRVKLGACARGVRERVSHSCITHRTPPHPTAAPRPTDLSYYNWDTTMSTTNSSPNFVVETEGGSSGIVFKVKRDRKVRGGCGARERVSHTTLTRTHLREQIISVDPAVTPGDNTTRTEIVTTEHLQVVLWDHFTRRKV